VTFNVSSPGHPFWIKTKQSTGTDNGYSGVNKNGIEEGMLTLTIPASGAPSQLFYNCEFHPPMTGIITVKSK